MTQNRNAGGRTRSRWLILVIALISGTLILGALVAGSYLIMSRLGMWGKNPDRVIGNRFPELTAKPKPHALVFKGCPPDGDGGDRILNTLKNRIDEGNYIALPFDVVEGLKWPQSVERRRRSDWTFQDADEVERYEGTPVSVEGYVADVKEEGPESPNCHGEEREYRDFHIWLTSGLYEDRSNSVVVEMTPPVRANHPGWRTNRLKQIAESEARVRVSGWLMLDPEHADQVGKTRGTIWEIHPVMKFEVERLGGWSALDDLP